MAELSQIDKKLEFCKIGKFLPFILYKLYSNYLFVVSQILSKLSIEKFYIEN